MAGTGDSVFVNHIKGTDNEATQPTTGQHVINTFPQHQRGTDKNIGPVEVVTVLSTEHARETND